MIGGQRSVAVEPAISEPRRPWGARFNRVAFTVLGVAVLLLGVVVEIASGWIAIVGALAFLVVALGIVAIEAAILYPLGRFPVVPWLPSRWTRQPGFAAGVIVVALALAVAREHGLGIFFARGSWRDMPVTVGKLAGTPFVFATDVSCEVRCERASDVCRELADRVAAGCSPREQASGHLALEISVDDPFCYTPLVKTALVRFTATATVRDNTAVWWRELQFDGSTRGLVLGVSSCSAFRHTAGRLLAADLVMAIRRGLTDPDLAWRCPDGSMMSGGDGSDRCVR